MESLHSSIGYSRIHAGCSARKEGGGGGIEQGGNYRGQGLLLIGLHLHKAVSQLQDGCAAISSTHSSHAAVLLDAEGGEGVVRDWQRQHRIILLQEEVPDVQQAICSDAEEYRRPAASCISVRDIPRMQQEVFTD